MAARRCLLPLVVGVTGKRNLLGHDDAVRRALATAFAKIDVHCSNTDKILLTGLAEGADQVAAQVALERPNWRVVAALPLPVELFIEDCEDDDERARLQSLLGAQRLLCRPLTLLRRCPGGDRFSLQELHRPAKDAPPNLDRRLHYEQLGLFIAARSALLIAVTDSAASTGKPGATERVVDFRLKPTVDELARGVLARSDEVAAPSPLDAFAAGPVWSFDLRDLERGERMPMRIFCPSANEIREAGPGPARERVAGADLHRSLAVPLWIEHLNRRVSALDDREWSAVGLEGEAPADAAALLARARRGMSAIQRGKMRQVRRSVHLLGMLFIGAVIAHECFVELRAYSWSRWMPLVYLAAAVGGVLVYSIAQRRRWQPVAEEYRAVMEALRVQLAWWAAGHCAPSDRVDRHYLRGAHGSLGRVREFLSQTLNAATVVGCRPTSDPDAVAGWISSQVDYFSEHVPQRRRDVLRLESTSWFLFASSLGTAACLAAMQTPSGALFSRIAEMTSAGAVVGIVIGSAAIIAVLARLGTGLAAEDGEEEAEESRSRRLLRQWSGPLAGMVLPFGLCALAALLPLPPLLDHERHVGESVRAALAVDLVTMGLILTAAVAGALRFRIEKLSLVSELRGYHQALNRFMRAQEGLATGAAGAWDVAEPLGLEALHESELWLRAHRERPLEPLVGG